MLALAVVAVVCWIALGSLGRRYQGRLERDWILSLTHGPSPQEIEQWRSLGPQAVPILCRALGQGTSPLRKKYQALWYKLPRWIKRRVSMPQDYFLIHRNALVVLAALRCDVNPAAPALARALYDDDSDVRIKSSAFLNKLFPGLGAERMRLVPDLVAALHDVQPEVRANAIQYLALCPEQSDVIAPAFVRAFDDPLPFNRAGAISSFKRMDLRAAAPKIEPLLLGCLTNADLEVRVTATVTLSDLKYNPAREVPVFAAMLNDKLPGTQCMGAVALGKYGPQAASAAPALRHAFETGEPRVRHAASNALVQIDPSTAAALAAQREPATSTNH